MNLYNIQQEYIYLMAQIEEQDGLLESEQIEQLNIVEENFKEKVTEYCKIIKQLEGEANMCQTEINRIGKLQKGKLVFVERLEKILLEAIKMFGDKEEKQDKSGAKYFIYRYNAEIFKLSTHRSKSVYIPDETLIDNNWKRASIGDLTLEEAVKALDAIGKSAEEVKYSTTILKTPIKKSIEEDNEIVNGATIIENFSLKLS